MNASAESPHGSASVLLAVASLSFVLLGFQISIMRLLSYTQWYHFASMTISIALLGFGGAGTILSIVGVAAVRRGMPITVLASLACSLLIALSPSVVSSLPVDPFLLLSDTASLVRLALLIGFLVLPFLAGAVVIGLSFQLFPGRIGRLYAANLIGSAAGTIGAVALLEVVDPEHLPPALAILIMPSVWLLVIQQRSQRAVAAVVTVGAFLLLCVADPALPMSQFKPLSKALLLEGSRVKSRETNPLGVLETVEGPALRYAPGVSLSFQGTIPAHDVIFQDGEWIGPLIEDEDSVAWPVYGHSTASFPYCLGLPERVLVLAAGTGADLLYARSMGIRSATGVEFNPALVRQFTERHPAVQARAGYPSQMVMVCDEARSFLQRDASTYGVIMLPILEGQIASTAGTQAVFENYLFTVEAFSLMIRRLEFNGVLVAHAWMTVPPRGSAKLLGTMIEALRANGIQNPGAHLAVIRSWNTVAIAASRQPLTQKDADRVRRFSKAMGFDLVCLPGLREDEVNQFHQLERPYLTEAGRALLGDTPGEFLRRYPFRVDPATDDKPYFSNFIAWSDLRRVLETYPSGQIPYLELGTFFLAVTAIVVVFLSLVLVGVPLVFTQATPSSRGCVGRSLLYFGGLGLGYMITEMVLIQKTILFLGDPIYAVALVVASLLASSSLGSAMSASFRSIAHHHPWLLPAAVLGLLALYALALSPLMSTTLTLGVWTRRLLLPAVLFPLGFVMGLPFPLGLSQLAQRSPALVPLAWGTNGCASVLAATSAVLTSMELGFGALQLFAVVAYAAAFAASPGRGGNAPQVQT